MTRWKVLGCCVLLILGGAAFHKNREVTELREEVRRHAMVSGEPQFFGATKPRGERPSKPNGGGFDEDENNELLAGMSAFHSNGDLSEEAIKRLGLTKEEAAATNDVMYQFRVEAERDLADRLKPTVNYSEDGSSRQRYYARARRDRGQAPFDELTLALGSVIGQDRSRRLMKAVTHDAMSARLCKLDLELEVIQPEKEGEEVKVSYQMRSPRNGGVTSFSGGITLAEFEREIGKIFDENGSIPE